MNYYYLIYFLKYFTAQTYPNDFLEQQIFFSSPNPKAAKEKYLGRHLFPVLLHLLDLSDDGVLGRRPRQSSSLVSSGGTKNAPGVHADLGARLEPGDMHHPPWTGRHLRQIAGAPAGHAAGAVIHRRPAVARRQRHPGGVPGPDARQRRTHPAEI